MRYPPEHKENVRRQIVRAAAGRFRGRGGEGVALADLMRDLDLTHGGFYRHFDSKEQLFKEALTESFAQARLRLVEAARRHPGHELEAIVNAYLSEGHCAAPEEGCPVAALATEVARHGETVRAELDRGVREHVQALSPYLPGKTRAERERKALVLFAGMAGALNLARGTADAGLRRTILESARAFYIQTLGGAGGEQSSA